MYFTNAYKELICRSLHSSVYDSSADHSASIQKYAPHALGNTDYNEGYHCSTTRLTIMDSRFDSIVIAKTATRRQFQGIWAGYGHKTQLLPKGWRREPGRRAVKEDIIWEKDVPISMRDGVRLQADVFRPARLEGQKLPTLLAWSPYGKTGTGAYHCSHASFG